MMKYIYVMIAITAIMVSAYAVSDSRVSYSVPFNDPDPSLKTSDSFYLNKMGIDVNVAGNTNSDGQIEFGDYKLPSIFEDIDEVKEGWNIEEREFNITDNKTLIDIKNAQAIDLTEAQMQRANISLGDESWL